MTTDSARRPIVTAILLGAVVVGAHTVFILLPQVFEPLRARFTDHLFSLRSKFAALRPSYDGAVIHVGIDDASRELGEHFYIGRTEHARLVRNLGLAGLAAQFHDVVFARPQEPAADRELIEATSDAGNVYYGIAVRAVPPGTAPDPPDNRPELEAVLSRNRWTPRVVGNANELYRSSLHFSTFSELAAAARSLVFLDAIPDRDGVYRRIPLIVRDRDGYLMGAALRVACDFLGVDPERIEIEPGRAVTLPAASRPGQDGVRDIRIPIDSHGRTLINYVGPWGAMTHYPFLAVFEASDDRFMMEDLRDEIAGKIAVVSYVATGSGDIGPVPGEAVYPLPGIHANLINSILTEQFLREWSTLRTALLVELPLLVILLLAALRLSTFGFLATTAGLLVTHAVIASGLFLYRGLVVDIPGPVVVVMASALVVAAFQYHVASQARAVLRSTFDAYFPPSVVSKIMADRSRLTSAAEKKELTVLFSDIKNFTRHTSEMDANHVRKLLNEYFESMIEIVFRHEGTLDKFIGDGLMVFFGDPIIQSDHAERCVRAAIDMQRAARRLNALWASRGDMPLEIRIGINTGHVVVGNMGSSRRLSYTVLGDAVNLAQRLESSAPVGGVLISQRTHELLAGAVPTRRVEPIQAKGFAHPIPVHEVAIEENA